MASEKLIQITKIMSTEKLLYCNKAIVDMIEKGIIINFNTVAETAGVSRPFLYNHQELRQLIEYSRISKMSKKDLQSEVVKLRYKVRQLEQIINQL